MNLETHFYPTAHGFQLALHCSVPSGKPVLCFTHGNGLAAKMYEPMLKHLSNDYDFVLLDAQGHGDSEHGGDFVGWNQSAELAAAAYQTMMQRYPDVAFIGVGHSFGGVITALVQAKYQLFQRILLLDPVIFTPVMVSLMRVLTWSGLYQHNKLAKRARQRKHQFDNYQQAWDYFYQRGLFRHWHDEGLHAYLRHGLRQHGELLQLKCAPQREAEIFASFPTQLWPQLRQLRRRVDLLIGTDTYPFVLHSARRLQRINQQVHTHRLQGGHCFMQEQPLHVALLIRRLLAGS